MKPRTRLVLAPHADDEVLGAGGAMARWCREGHEVHVVVATRGYPPLFPSDAEALCREEALRAHHRLGVASTRFLELPAAGLDTLQHRELNGRLLGCIQELKPDELYLPFLGDLHRDHQLVFQSALVAARPNGPAYPRRIYAYEVLSETNWNAPYLSPAFVPNHFVDIGATLDLKLEAFGLFKSQVKDPPHERSLAALRSLALLRGATVGLPAAEAFVTIRTVD